VLRASAACEAAGIPSSSLIGEGFILQAAATSVGMGMRDLPVALVPGHPTALSTEELKRNTLEVTLGKVIENLTQVPGGGRRASNPNRSRATSSFPAASGP